jgi:hypothetical protein
MSSFSAPHVCSWSLCQVNLQWLGWASCWRMSMRCLEPIGLNACCTVVCLKTAGCCWLYHQPPQKWTVHKTGSSELGFRLAFPVEMRFPTYIHLYLYLYQHSHIRITPASVVRWFPIQHSPSPFSLRSLVWVRLFLYITSRLLARSAQLFPSNFSRMKRTPNGKKLDTWWNKATPRGLCVYSFPIGRVSYLLYLMDPYINLTSIGHVRSYRGDAINDDKSYACSASASVAILEMRQQ